MLPLPYGCCKRNKQLANVIKGALPAGFLGIGEPLIYGVNLAIGKTILYRLLRGIGGAVIGGIGHIGARAMDLVDYHYFH